MNKNDIIYIGINNWFYERDFPPIKQLEEWVDAYKFNDDEWCKEQKLCVVSGVVDMSVSWLITATRDWVEQNLPELLTDGSYTYGIVTHDRSGEHETQYTKKFSDFVYHPDDPTRDFSFHGYHFKEYDEEDFGCEYQDNYWN